MITRITAVLQGLTEETALFAVPPFDYEVFIPEYTRRHLQTQVGQTVTLHTIYFIEGNPAQGGRMAPKLLGFLTPVEREFFEMFCSVDGVGTKKALRAMTQPVQDTAVLIEQQDAKGLSALPGIGPATAERIIAKLRRKMARFALLVRREFPVDSGDRVDVLRDAFDALCVLGHSSADARKLIDQAVETGKKFKDTETLIQAIYMMQLGG